MSIDTRSLRLLDTKLEEQADCLSEGARDLPSLSPVQREELRRRVLRFLRHDVAEHMRTDQRVLYPKIAQRLDDPLAAAPMNYDHRAIGWWTGEIAGADIADTSEFQRLLYGLHALIKVHLSREEDLYLGALESASWPADVSATSEAPAQRNGHGDD